MASRKKILYWDFMRHISVRIPDMRWLDGQDLIGIALFSDYTKNDVMIW